VTRRRARRAAVIAIALLALAACGKRGNPVAPQVRVPRPVTDLTAVARADHIELGWTVPRRRADGSRLLDPGVARLYRTDDDGIGEPRAALRVKDRIPGYTEVASFPLADATATDTRDSHLAYVDRRELTFGRRYTYVVTTSDTRGHVSAPSARASVTFIAPPEPPTGLRAEAGESQVRLSWDPPARLADGSAITGPLVYEVARTPDATTPPTAVGRTAPGETSFVDRGATNDLTYQYTVRAIRTEGANTGTSGDSAPITAIPAKTTPPAPPTDLAAIASRGEVRLSWTPSPAADVAAYVIYRAGAAGAFTRVGSVKPPATTFLDRDVPPGRYRYAVRAQDTSTRANESAASNEVTVSVP
jgi:hypothetical protein